MTPFYRDGCAFALSQTGLTKLALGSPMSAQQNAPLSSTPSGALGGNSTTPPQRKTHFNPPPFGQAAAPQTPEPIAPSESPASAPGLKGVSSGR